MSGVRKNTRDVGMTFPTPSSSEARMEEDSDVTSWSEEKIEEKRLLTSYLVDKKLKKAPPGLGFCLVVCSRLCPREVISGKALAYLVGACALVALATVSLCFCL